MTSQMATPQPPRLFVALLTYIRPLEEIDASGEDHVAWLKRGYEEGVFLVSGRRVPRTGGVILARGASLADVEARMRLDPLQTRGLAIAEVIAFEGNLMSDSMRAAIAAAVVASHPTGDMLDEARE